MPAPQNNQGFVQPSSGGTGNWLSKLFGGVADRGRERSMAQLQLDLHAGKADIDTFHKKDRMNYQAAVGEYTADSSYRRSGREMRRGIKAGPAMGTAGLSGFDKNGRPIMQKTGQQRPDKPQDTTGATNTPDDNNPPPPPPGPTPPPDRGNDMARKPKGGSGSQTPATKTKSLDSTPSSTPVSTSTNGKAEPELFPGYGPTFDGNGDNTQSPAGKATAAKRARTPKAGA